MAQAVVICRGVIHAGLQSKLGSSSSSSRVQPNALGSLSSLSSDSAALFVDARSLQRTGLLTLRTSALFGSKTKTKAPPKKEAKKAKTEDGIFGTSGGIGFTKQNELFVGRVAMLGFAASLLGEAITGKGVLAQFDLETGIPLYETEPLLAFFILFTLLGAIGALGDRGKFVDDPPTGLDKAVIPPGKGVKSALGLNEKGPTFGFTKANELFVGRLAQLGIAFSIIGELVTGKGALAQLNIETGVPITEIEPLILFNVIFFFFAAINPGTGRFVSDVEEED
ncbi:hypothetical protein O6H91_12G079500 [Diphasiastrum complanatum]|uniref:Uncharacterized protein n=1 Tax=Diphasiastrum complanatum TaxID=34168 RepID=A0ACC2C3Z3_DIPCM|nr:hypothetical protein O6H91_12G079500 [Diphasiastrum complanatum]